MKTMITALEPLWKSKDKMMAGWTPEPIAVSSYNIYVGLAPVLSSLTLLKNNISPYRSDVPQALKKVACEILVSDVRTVLGLSSSIDFSNTVFYFAITYLNLLGAESAIADSILVTVPPVGIGPKTRGSDDKSIERYVFGFSDDIQKWVKLVATPQGALMTSTSSLYALNTVTEYTYDGTNVETMKTYSSDMTASGSPAKLTSYEYSGSQVTKVTMTDSTV